MSQFTIENVSHPEGLVVKVSGHMDFVNADKLSAHLTKITVQRPPLVVLDLSQGEFLSSLCIGLLVNFRQGLLRHGSDVRLAAVHPLVADALRRVGLQKMFPIFDTVNLALATAVSPVGASNRAV